MCLRNLTHIFIYPFLHACLIYHVVSTQLDKKSDGFVYNRCAPCLPLPSPCLGPKTTCWLACPFPFLQLLPLLSKSALLFLLFQIPFPSPSTLSMSFAIHILVVVSAYFIRFVFFLPGFIHLSHASASLRLDSISQQINRLRHGFGFGRRN